MATPTVTKPKHPARPVPAIGVAVRSVSVTPALAEAWLKTNTHNRNLRERAVMDYARDMVDGNWMENGETIKFAKDGTLPDGQHRLTAVTLASVAVVMLVVTGLDPITQETMDAGAKRSIADAFGLRGETNATVLAAIAKRVWMWERGNVKFNGNATPTTAECAAVLAERPDLRRSADIAVRIHATFKFLPKSVVGVAHHLFCQIDLAEATWFFQRLGDGAELTPGHPILTLRTRAMFEAGDKRKVTADRYMAYLIRAWNATRDGRTLDRIMQPADAPMPTPH